MQQIVSITNQGQITIPAAFRKVMGLNQYRKASVRTENNKIVVEPIPDLMSLAGSLQNRALKNKKIGEVIRIEKESVGKVISQSYSPKKK